MKIDELKQYSPFQSEGIAWNGRCFETSSRVLFLDEEALESYTDLDALFSGVEAIIGGRYTVFNSVDKLLSDPEVDRLIALERAAEPYINGSLPAPEYVVEPVTVTDSYIATRDGLAGTEFGVDFLGRKCERKFAPAVESSHRDDEDDYFSAGATSVRYGELCYNEWELV